MDKSFWIEQSNKNMYYAKYVLPYSAIIHIISLLVIDIYLFNQDLIGSSILRLVPVFYLLILFIYVRKNNTYLRKNNIPLFFLAGLISSFPVSYHAANDLIINNMLFSSTMGIVFIKVMMINFIFMPRKYVFTLYGSMDLILFSTLSYFSWDDFYDKVKVFITYTLLADIILLIAYFVNLDLKFKNYTITNQIKNEIEFKNRYFNLLAHDLKSPVNLMQSVVELLKTDDIDESRKKQYYLKLDSQLKNLNNLIINVLDWIRTNNFQIELKLESIKIKSCIESIIKNHQDSIKNKDLEIVLDGKNEEITFDKISLEIIINNLFRNAIKFSNKGNKIYINLYKNNFSIQNTGLEIDEKQVTNFNNSRSNYAKNGTNGEKGHGLGLEIVKNLVQHNNSTISITKDSNSTKFTIDF